MSGKSKKNTSCPKVKNACKYCLESVNPRNGLQCQGACQKWAHYNCLNYTPGKISDIKAGIIKVMCPCPDCDTTQPKEFLTKPPYSCSSQKCPANAPIKCASADCPQNEGMVKEMECSTTTCPGDKEKVPMNVNIKPQRWTGPVQTRPNTAPYRPTPTAPHIRRTQKETRSREYKTTPTPKKSLDSCENDCHNGSSNASISDDENCPQTQQLMAEALREMSGTVGQLSTQIKELIVKINKLA